MTPQLQQAIRLLQLSAVDLQQEIQNALDSNMMLEVPDEQTLKTEQKNSTIEGQLPSNTDGEQMPDELVIDASWDDIYDPTTSAGLPRNTEDTHVDPGAINAAAETLQDRLVWQMELSNLSDTDRAIATTIIDAIDDDGYLNQSVESLFSQLVNHLENLELDEVVAVLHKVQSFDPPGVAALDLQECLLLQLKQLPDKTPFLSDAIELLSEQMEALGAQDIEKLKRNLHFNDDTLSQVLSLIRSLNPKPGSVIQSTQTNYITPDVYVRQIKGRWRVSLNGKVFNTLRVNPLYESMIKRGDKTDDGQVMKNHLQEARWFIKSLHNRNATLLRVSQEIVDRQTNFLTHGAVAMKPLVLRDIADVTELHESTISRVTSQKYLHTPNGIFELKYFFSSHVSTDSGGECSATAIRAFIKELVNNENPKKPLSDNKIAAILSGKGINIARRTIAKYRESISIPSSSQRKQLL
jgi:RNA polymerase sigma-54 factor